MVSAQISAVSVGQAVIVVEIDCVVGDPLAEVPFSYVGAVVVAGADGRRVMLGNP